MTEQTGTKDSERLRVSAEEGLPADWDDFVASAAGATFCHLGAWLSVMEDALGHESFRLTARDEEGRLRGVLPLVRVRSRLFGDFLVSMPFLNYGGALGPRGARLALAQWAVDMAARERVDLLELRWRGAALADDGPSDDSAQLDEMPRNLRTNARKITVLLPLPEEARELWEKGLRAKVRSQIRRPMKENFEVRTGPQQVEPFYSVFAHNMRDLGTPVLPLQLFRRLPRMFGDGVLFATVYEGERPIAAGCGFFFGHEFEITWASALREFNRLAPNMLLYWRMIETAIERGARVFNFGRCTPGSGTHRFKKQWGGHDEPLPWAVWSPGEETATPNPDQGKYALAASVWRKLPVPLTRVIGPPLARRIP